MDHTRDPGRDFGEYELSAATIVISVLVAIATLALIGAWTVGRWLIYFAT